VSRARTMPRMRSHTRGSRTGGGGLSLSANTRLELAKSAHGARYAGGGPVQASGPASQRPAPGTSGGTPPAPPPQAAPPSQAREKGPCVGDTRLIFHNRQGEATDTAMAFESLEHRLLPRAAVVAIAEAGWDAKMIDVVEKRMHTKCHRLYCAPANGRAPRGSVTAIVVRADVNKELSSPPKCARSRDTHNACTHAERLGAASRSSGPPWTSSARRSTRSRMRCR
jgi:hypothetical protein